MLKPSKDFLRFLPASSTATAVDFGVSYLAVHFLNFPYMGATIIGNFAGGIVGFFLTKYWVFQNYEPNQKYEQAIKYMLVSAGNSVLNTAGVGLVSHFIKINYLFIRALVGLVVFLVYSYGLNKWFVFRTKNNEKALQK